MGVFDFFDLGVVLSSLCFEMASNSSKVSVAFILGLFIFPPFCLYFAVFSVLGFSTFVVDVVGAVDG